LLAAAFRELPRQLRRRSPDLALKLWGGFSTDALPELEAIRQSRWSPRKDRLDAAFELARWHASRGNFEAAVRNLASTTQISPAQRLPRRFLLLEAALLVKLQRLSEAEQRIALAVARYGYDADLTLLSANAAHGERRQVDAGSAADELRLKWINRIYAGRGMHTLRKIDSSAPLSLANIAAVPGKRCNDGPKVSVIIPAFNAEKTVGVALASLRQQTWQNIEILVVDDVSSDATCRIVEAAAAADQRVKLLRQPENAGAYAARNRGLDSATGDYVTVHDADDWSHAQKIEVQVGSLLESRCVGCASYYVRVSDDFRFELAWPSMDRLCERYVTSLMLPTRLVRQLGGWDRVRVGADSELTARLRTKFGKAALTTVADDVPLSFALAHENSLTRKAPTGLQTRYFGLRKDYRESYLRWHAAARATSDFELDRTMDGRRKFPAPAAILPNRPNQLCYDLLFISDFSQGAPRLPDAICRIQQARERQGRIAIFHWPRYDRPANLPLDRAMATLLDTFAIDRVSGAERVHAKVLVLCDPLVAYHRFDHTPDIAVDELQVWQGTIRSRAEAQALERAAPLIRENLVRLFGTEGTWLTVPYAHGVASSRQEHRNV
jgi:glycosyltransferase involved in cell wall biosynthesis